MSLMTTVLIVVLVVVAALVSLPILFETVVNVLAGTCFPGLRARPAVARAQQCIDT